MKIKKNLTLISLMLGVMMLVSLTGMVSATTIPVSYVRPCAGVDLCTWNNPLPLGSGDTSTSGCGLSWNTPWALNTEATATCFFDGYYLKNAMLYVSINNDIVSCTLNGQEVLASTVHEGCAPVDPRIGGLSADVYSKVIPGTNTLVCKVKDRGIMTHFDACVVGEYNPTCKLVIDEPVEGKFYDPIAVTWHLEGNACHPVHYQIQYKAGNCDTGGAWTNIATDIDPANAGTYDWNSLPPSGQYCLRVTMQGTDCSPGCCSVTGYSGVFNLDLANPEVDLEVGSPKVGECVEETTGDCYINQQTPLTLTCAKGTELWQSEIDKIEYRINGGNWITYTNPFSFSEDSNHLLEYRCYDKVGKVDTEEKRFIVETVGPVLIGKTVGDPKLDGCNFDGPNTNKCDWYVTKNTEICVDYDDLGNHPVGGVEVWCEWNYGDTIELGQLHTEFKLPENGCFTYSEDSFHELHCWAIDALENRNKEADLYEADIVDTVAPTTILSYNGPQYLLKDPKWIDTVSTVVLTPSDPQPHPVGVGYTKYRVGLLTDDSWCYGTHAGGWQTTSKESPDWQTYSTPFGIEESCHVIEYYSVDRLGNAEDVQYEFVFSDHTAPTLFKDVGEPNSKCGLFNNCGDPIWNWNENPELVIEYEVTLNTDIIISCEDQGPHPSGVGNSQTSGIYYRVVLDGKYNDPSANWKFAQSDEFAFRFPEQSEHLLEFYCIDNVGKTSETDSELFKVTGTAFDLVIGDKWDLISVPFQLIGDGNVEDVFDDSKVVEVWSYENGEWEVYSPSDGLSGLDKIVPGRGYWVKTTDGTKITIGGSLMKPASAPPSVELDKGWNLIGHYDLSPRKAYCSLFSLVDTQQGFPRWSALWGYISASQTFMPLTQWDNTIPGKGYWIEMDVEDSYSPSSICYGFQQLG